jgi:hypothetical protein
MVRLSEAPRTKAGADESGTESGVVDPERRCTVAHAAAEPPERQDGASTLSTSTQSLDPQGKTLSAHEEFAMRRNRYIYAMLATVTLAVVTPPT